MRSRWGSSSLSYQKACPFFLVKLHVLRPVACSYSKMLGGVQSQIYPRSMTMWFWPSKMSQTESENMFFFVYPHKNKHLYIGRCNCALWSHMDEASGYFDLAPLDLFFFSEDFFQNDENKSSFTEIDRRCCQWTILLLTVHSFLTRNKYYHITSIQSHEYPSWTGNKEHLAQNFWIFLTSTDKSYPKHFRFMQDE